MILEDSQDYCVLWECLGDTPFTKIIRLEMIRVTRITKKFNVYILLFFRYDDRRVFYLTSSLIAMRTTGPRQRAPRGGEAGRHCLTVQSEVAVVIIL